MVDGKIQGTGNLAMACYLERQQLCAELRSTGCKGNEAA
jgi:hypothetical protein